MSYWERFKRTYLWRHRTKNIGIAGFLAGAAKNYLATHHLWYVSAGQEGWLLSFFGAIVVWVGIYNTIHERFGEPDEPEPPP